MRKGTKYVVGFILLFIALLATVGGASIPWGVTGALFAAGITVAIYGLGFIISAESED